VILGFFIIVVTDAVDLPYQTRIVQTLLHELSWSSSDSDFSDFYLCDLFCFFLVFMFFCDFICFLSLSFYFINSFMFWVFTDVTITQIIECVPRWTRFALLSDCCNSSGLIEGAEKRIGFSNRVINRVRDHRPLTGEIPTGRDLGILMASSRSRVAIW
jgi:hypothetical protein